MTLLQQIYPGDAVASFLIRVLAEITLVTVAGLTFARLFARTNPALRHGICLCALFCVLFAPLTTFGLQQAGWRTFEISLEPAAASRVVVVPSDFVSSAAPVALKEPFWTVERVRSAASLTLLIWALGIGLLTVRLFYGTRKVNRIRRMACEVEHPKLDAALEQLRRTGKVPDVPVRFVRRLHSPIVVGPWRTTVILPEKLLEQLNEEQMCSVLAHELTHVRQRDPLIGLIQRVVEAGYWPHPLVHFLNRDLVRAREEVCDNAALHGTTAPRYADTLLTVALGMPAKAPAPGLIGLMTPPWRLEERVKGLLDPRRRLNTTMNTRHLALMATALATGTTLIAGAHVAAAPMPRTQQQEVELTTHYNPVTKSVTVKVKKIKPTTKVVLVKTASQKGKSLVRVRYAPSDMDVFLDPTKGLSRDVFVGGTASGKGQDKVFLHLDGKVDGVVHSGVIHVDPIGDRASVQTSDVRKDTAAGPVFMLDGKLMHDVPGQVFIEGGHSDGGRVFLQGGDVKSPEARVFVQDGQLKIEGSDPVTTQGVKGTDGTMTIQSGTVLIEENGKVKEYKIGQTPLKADAFSGTRKFSFTYPAKGPQSVDTQITQAWTRGKDSDPTVSFTTTETVNPASVDTKRFIDLRGKDKQVIDTFKFDPTKRGVNDFVIKQSAAPKTDNVIEYVVTGDSAWKPMTTQTVHLTPLKSIAPAHKDTTVYIDGDKIRIVGDSVKVVYVKSLKSAPKHIVKVKALVKSQPKKP